MSPFTRYIHSDEMWLYRNPRSDPYVTNTMLWSLVILSPLIVGLLYLLIKRDKNDFIQFMLAVTLSVGINGILTNMIKLIVGRPRPDYFWRCFPDGEMNSEMQCTGSYDDVIEGRKSFPSGHSSLSFSSLGTVAWWLMGKLHIWSSCKGSAWRFLISFVPLVIATIVALSRTCDYHHHWQDVTVGSILGLIISYGCYRQHYPSLNSPYCHKPYISHRQSISTIQRKENSYLIPHNTNTCLSCRISSSEHLSDMLIEESDCSKSNEKYDESPNVPIKTKEQIKWI